MKKFIYADNAATTKLSKNAFDEMKIYFIENYSNPSQPYSFASKSKIAIKKARKIIAECINAKPEEIYFTSGGTESNNWAIKCFGSNNRNNSVYVSKIEHHSVLNACKSVKGDVHFLNVDSYGKVDPLELQQLLECKRTNMKPTTSLVSVMMGNNEIGTIEPIRELVQIAHSFGAYFHTDAVQCVGHIKIDVKELNIDMLSASAHKFNGPKGIGFLYVKSGTPLNIFIEGGSQENNFRAGTENVPAIIGMAAALKENCDKIDVNTENIYLMENYFLSKLKENNIDFVRNGSSDHVPGIINISIKGCNGEMLLHRLDLMGIYISTGSACDSINNQVSHVIREIKVSREYAEGTIRISFGKENSIDDAIIIADSLKKIIKYNNKLMLE